MSLEKHKELVRHALDQIYNMGNLDIAEKTHAADFTLHVPFMPDLPIGPEGSRHYSHTIRQALPDMHLEVEDIIAEGDRVAVRYRARGTHRGPFLGIAPSGKFVDVTGQVLYRIEHHRIAEAWVSPDTLGMLHDIGIPLPITVAHAVHT